MTRARIAGGYRDILQTLVIWLLLALTCSFAAALDDHRTIAQFAHTAWGPKDGAPNVITSLAQSTDGYLWLGSPEGLYRFDGVTFEHYQPQSGELLPTRTVRLLLAVSNGDLWIGYRSGEISLLRNGHATNYTERDGVPGGLIWSLAQDREGSTWAATTDGLVRLEGSRWKEVGKDWNFPGKSSYAIFLDRQGTLWVSTEDTVVFLPPGTRRFKPTDIKVGQVTKITQAANGKLWMAETTRSVRPIPLSDNLRPADETEVKVGSQAILFDRDGALWIGSLGDGLRRSSAPELLNGKIKEFGTAVESFAAKDGLSDDLVLAILQDREGNIWVGTNSGLDRFRRTDLVPVTLPFKPWYAVLGVGDAGDAWVASMTVMFRVHGGRADRSHPIPCQSVSTYRDRTGAIWWLCIDSIYRYKAGRYTRFALPSSFPKPYVASMMVATEDSSGTLWMCAERQGLFYLKGQVWHRLDSASEFANLAPSTAYTDWMGRAWFAYEGGTIIVVEHGSIQRVFPADESPTGIVRAINGRGRHIWISGELGLAFFDGDRFRRIVPIDAETFGSVLGVEETFDGSLWLAERRRVIQIPASEVRQALDRPSYRVKFRIFDFFDGLPGTLAGTATNQKEIQGTDGRLWFAASGGIVWIDPANISTNTLPPTILIKSVRANGREPGSLENLVLSPRTTNLQIGYTALSLSVPERVRFRYRLEGVDKEWQDVGTRREAFYTKLGPGGYHFRVIACNNDGVWNNAGAELDFTIAPAWFQTVWFLAACVAVGFFFVFAIYRIRMRQVAHAMAERFDERLDERTRIARDFHDTLLQTIQGSKLVADSALKRANDPLRMREALEQLSIWLARATTEGRAALNSLRTSTTETNDLAEAFRRALAECRTEIALDASFSVVGDARDMHPIVRDEVYRVGYEAIRNACVHSHASRLQVTLTYGDELGVEVADNGVGMDPSVAERGKEGHFGLRGMRERAARIAGKLTVTSSPSSGTQVQLIVPGKIIYRRAASKNH